MSKHVFIMRGIPGSGKSTFVAKKAREIDENLPLDLEVVSADHYFETCPCDFGTVTKGYSTDTMREYARSAHNRDCIKEKVYKFDATKLGKAHQACQDRFVKLIESPDTMYIFVDNTNLTFREMAFYVKMCIGNDIPFTIVNVRCDVDKAAARNAHGVPDEKVRQMAARMRHGDEELSKLDYPQEDFYSE